MPTYDYTCQNCEAKSEVLQKITDEPLITCEHCLQKTLKRGFGGGLNLVFKGAGFYVNDYCPPKPNDVKPAHDGSFAPCPCGKSSPCST